jgi:hypothetical protein
VDTVALCPRTRGEGKPRQKVEKVAERLTAPRSPVQMQLRGCARMLKGEKEITTLVKGVLLGEDASCKEENLYYLDEAVGRSIEYALETTVNKMSCITDGIRCYQTDMP